MIRCNQQMICQIQLLNKKKWIGQSWNYYFWPNIWTWSNVWTIGWSQDCTCPVLLWNGRHGVPFPIVSSTLYLVPLQVHSFDLLWAMLVTFVSVCWEGTPSLLYWIWDIGVYFWIFGLIEGMKLLKLSTLKFLQDRNSQQIMWI